MIRIVVNGLETSIAVAPPAVRLQCFLVMSAPRLSAPRAGPSESTAARSTVMVDESSSIRPCAPGIRCTGVQEGDRPA